MELDLSHIPAASHDPTLLLLGILAGLLIASPLAFLAGWMAGQRAEAESAITLTPTETTR